MSGIRHALSVLGRDLRHGLACALLQRPGHIETSAQRLAWLFFANVALAVMLDYLTAQPAPTFNRYAFTEAGFRFAALLFGSLLAMRTLKHQAGPLAPAHHVLALTPWMMLAQFALEQTAAQPDVLNPGAQTFLQWFLFTWYLAALYRVLAGSAPAASQPRVLAAWLILLLGYVAPSQYFAAYSDYWFAEKGDADDTWAAYRNLDAEAMFYAQPQRLQAALDALRPQRPGVADLYFLGFAGYARQDVFRKETEYARQLFDRRFDTAGRSLMLVNHLDTRDSLPLATSHNLARALRGIATRMDPEEDVLVLFMTSHGSRSHKLSVDFWPLPLNDITPAMLRHDLDQAGIKWRILIVSACYSGGFLQPLQTPWSWIASAAAPDRTSFGCGEHNDFTWFSEALLKEQLDHRFDFNAAFEAAASRIAEREQAHGYPASRPALYIGDAMRKRLPTLQASLAERLCRRQDGDAATGDCRLARKP
ncbi:MAG TPA: hypothetical protein ENJ79_03455 [Gammaproteobacteria bacterium]|nr:hypothetical protein [Gammaproteobacteria bacterium]